MNKNYEKFVADREEYFELSDYDSNLYDDELKKELFETEKVGVIFVTPDDTDSYYSFYDWLEESSYIAQETKNGSFIFHEDKDLIEKLEHDLYLNFQMLNINVTIK